MVDNSMTKQAKILWMDLEMTGLEPEKDRILEVAVIVTDWDFKEIATQEEVVAVDKELFAQRIKDAPDFWNTFPHVRDALLKQNASPDAKTAKEVENILINLADTYFEPDQRILLAGNSIHQDRKFIDKEWPRFSKRLHYRMLDVSAWKVVFEGKYKKKYAKPENHRALDDIRGSIEELHYYIGKVRA